LNDAPNAVRPAPFAGGYAGAANVDKAYHLAAGALIYTVSHAIDLPDSVSLAIVLLAAVAKELSDYASSSGQVEALDIVATMLGGLAAYAAFNAYRLRLHN
jgi:hypothetical protein